ncbi:alpha/beta fold hydrolase [Hamadaea tsunoensis]|uniref:alpha/beta fold hydrolase n=1 Tax=Hamadaea tsunoensis TaxID=53368 RepID=UPI0005592387|nr:alpha/beta hydrolase [Hamadaea tsunoensis]
MSATVSAPAQQRSAAVSPDGTRIAYRTMGTGPGLIVVGGALRTSEDYVPLARALADRCTVHLVERRGRGASGPQGPGYSLDREVDDLLAVQAQTGARLAFGHSFGGFALVETALRSAVFHRIALYEPGVPCEPIATGWMEPYRQRLAAGDPYGAFAHFIRGSSGAPAAVAKMPYWYLRLAMQVGFRGAAWQRMRPLLEANLAEHEQIAARRGHLAEYAAITVPVLVLHGSRTAAAIRTQLDALSHTLPGATSETMPGLSHFGPEGKTAPAVAERASAFLL